MKLIRLTDKVWVNPNAVTLIQAVDPGHYNLLNGGCLVYVGENYIAVELTVLEVANKLMIALEEDSSLQKEKE